VELIEFRPEKKKKLKKKKSSSHHCPEGAGLASTWSTSIEQRALAMRDACDSRRSPVGHSALPLVGAISLSAAATQSKPFEEEEEEFELELEVELAGAGAGAAAEAVVAAALEGSGTGAGDASSAAAAAAGAAMDAAPSVLGTAKGLTAREALAVVATIASAGAANPSVTPAVSPVAGIPAPRSAPLAAAASSKSAGRYGRPSSPITIPPTSTPGGGCTAALGGLLEAMAAREPWESVSASPGAVGIGDRGETAAAAAGAAIVADEAAIVELEVEKAGAVEEAAAEAEAEAEATGSTPVKTGAGAVLGANVAGGGATELMTTPGSASLGAAKPPGIPLPPPPTLGACLPAREATPGGLSTGTLMGSGASSSARETPTSVRGGAAEEMAVGGEGGGVGGTAGVAGEEERAEAAPKPKPYSLFGVTGCEKAGLASATGTAAKLPSPTGMRARVVVGAPAAGRIAVRESLGAADEEATVVIGGGGGGGGGGAGAAGGFPSITVPRSLVPSQVELICARDRATREQSTSDARRRQTGEMRLRMILLLRRRGETPEKLAAAASRRAADETASLLASPLKRLLLLLFLRNSDMSVCLLYQASRIDALRAAEVRARERGEICFFLLAIEEGRRASLDAIGFS